MVIDDVAIGAHRHHRCLDLDLLQDLLLGHLHHAYCPALIGVLTVECLVHCAHRTLTQLLCEPIDLVGVVRQKPDLGDLLVELLIREQRIIRDLFLGFQALHDLEHHLRILFNELTVDVTLTEDAHHLGSQSFDAQRTAQVHLQVHLMLEV